LARSKSAAALPASFGRCADDNDACREFASETRNKPIAVPRHSVAIRQTAAAILCVYARVFVYALRIISMYRVFRRFTTRSPCIIRRRTRTVVNRSRSTRRNWSSSTRLRVMMCPVGPVNYVKRTLRPP